MNATAIYLKTCRYVIAADFADRETWSDLYRYLPYLRQSLSCFVCRNLVLKPLAPGHKNCFHFVCEKCKGGRMKLKPQCSWCKNYHNFQEQTQLRVLVLCFCKLCEYIHNTPIGADLRSLSTNGETNNLVKIIQEALDFHDDFQIPDLLLPPPFLPPKLTETKSSTIPSMPTDQSPSTSSSAIVSTGPSSKSKTTTDLGTELQSADISHSSTDDESDVVVDVGHDEPPELSPLSSDEIIDVCKTPSPIEKEKHHKKKKSVLSISFDKAKDASSLQQKVLVFNCEDKSIANKVHVSSPVMELAVKKAKVVSNPNKTEVKICKCGRGGTNSRLTCLGQRCPCYIKKLPCIGCRCTGCRNPRKPGHINGSNKMSHDSKQSNSHQSENNCLAPVS